MSEDLLTYLHLLDIDSPDKPVEVYRLLDRELSVGMIIERSVKEGYIPYEIISFTHKEKVFGDHDLCEVQIKKHPFIKKIEDISEVLLAQSVTKENLDNHKRLINDLLQLNNEKRDKIYHLKNV